MKNFLILAALTLFVQGVFAKDVALTCVPKNELQPASNASILISLDDDSKAISFQPINLVENAIFLYH